MKKSVTSVPMSAHTKHTLHEKDIEFHCGFSSILAFLLSTIGLITAIIATCAMFKDWALYSWLALLPVPATLILAFLVWFLPWLYFQPLWHYIKDDILQKNAIDYERSQKLEAAFKSFRTVPVSTYQTLHTQIPGFWRPFRIEHFVSATVRSEITGRLNLRSLLQTKNVQGLSVPNLLDTSSIVWLVNEADETLRVLLPSPSATHELFCAIKKHWQTYNREDRRTHCDHALDGFRLSHRVITEPIDHVQLVDALDVSCQQSLSSRPCVEVYGQMIQPGVAIGTALRVIPTNQLNNDVAIFFPDGFLSKLTFTVAAIMGKDAQAPQPSDAIAV